MKKVLIANEAHDLLKQDKRFLDRADITLFFAASNDEVLKTHRAERLNLIILKLGMPGMSSEQLCSLIREDAGLRAVSVIMLCENNQQAIEQALRCRTNAVLLAPVHPLLLGVKAEQLVDVAKREPYRALVAVTLEGGSRKATFFCRSRNISPAGILLETDQRLADGARLSCSFLPPHSTTVVHASGKIVRTVERAALKEGRLYGVMFTDLSPDVRKQLMSYSVEPA